MQSDLTPLPFLVYGAYGIIATAFAAIVNYLLLRSIKNIGIKNNLSHNGNGHANLVRWASQTKPTLGGFSFFILFLLSVSSYYLLPFKNNALPVRELFALLGSVSIGFVVGLVDDSFHMPPMFKFAGQLLCSLLMISMGVYINVSGVWGIDALFTAFWVVGIMNAINMLDNMDGIAATVAAGILACAIVILYLQGNFTGFYAIVFVGVLAALLGFLFFNWYPSKMYMGDSGSQFLGALLAFAGILLVWPQYRPANVAGFYLPQFVLPAVIFALPIIDTTTVFVYRLARKQSPFTGGRDHTTHHLVYFGLTDKAVAGLAAIVSALSAAVTVAMVKRYEENPYSFPLVAALYWLVLFVTIQYLYRIGKKKHG